MFNYYSTIRDNFFSNPDLIRDYALSLDMKSDNSGRWPGVRSKVLHEINKDLNDYIVAKILSCYYDFDKYAVNWDDSMCHFQLINKVDDAMNQGWVHSDGCSCDVASIVYLNKNPNPDAGTSLYELLDLTKGEDLGDNLLKMSEKIKFYRGENVSKLNFTNQLTEYNNNFQETVRIQNVYNRCITYGRVYHRANSFNMNNEEPRLTLVSFIRGIHSEETKPSNFRQYSFDKDIEDVIK